MSDLGDALNVAKVTPEELREALSWVREGRAPSVGEAREYFDVHAEDGGDPETMEECQRVLDVTQHPTRGLPGTGYRGTTQSPFPPATEDQLEEEGSD